MNAQDLKNSILQLAIQGKLVEQREEEGTAKELLEKIKAEKKQLSKEGKIKKKKDLLAIKEDEIPFDIPESWEWVRLGEITHNWGQKKPDKIFDYIDVGSIDNINGVLSSSENLIKPEDAPSRARKIVKEGTVLYSTVRPYLLNICIVDKEFDYEPIASTAFAILHPFSGVNSSFLYYILRSPMFISYVTSVMIGVTYPAINDTNLLDGLIPLPPLEEQKRIAAKIQELSPYVDKYDVAYSQVDELNKKFPAYMQKSILQYAIQGKILEQREEDGTAEELFKQIQEEKRKLIKEGKIKMTEALPGITEDEPPFDIPENWKWVRLGDIVSVRGGKRLPPGKKLTQEKTNHIYIRVTDMKNQTIDDTDLHYISNEIHDKISNYIIEKSDIYIVIVGSTIGKVGLVPEKFHGMNLTENAARLIPICVDIEYLMRYLTTLAAQTQFIDLTKQVGQPKLALTRLKNILVPLPPLKEQKRIVEKIEELLPYTKKWSISKIMIP